MPSKSSHTSIITGIYPQISNHRHAGVHVNPLNEGISLHWSWHAFMLLKCDESFHNVFSFMWQTLKLKLQNWLHNFRSSELLRLVNTNIEILSIFFSIVLIQRLNGLGKKRLHSIREVQKNTWLQNSDEQEHLVCKLACFQKNHKDKMTLQCTPAKKIVFKKKRRNLFSP